MSAIQRFAANDGGRDFVVGDIHGCFAALAASLQVIGFDESHDRLFSVGDLVDRGPESEQALEWLAKPWFHAVRGNHEQMAIDYADGELEPSIYMANGGAWFIGKTAAERAELAHVFRALAIAIEIETAHGPVGIVHADCPVAQWQDLELALAGPNGQAFENCCLWSRDRITSGAAHGVEGVYAVICGHTPLQAWEGLGNVIYIDTGMVFGRHFTFVELGSMSFTEVKKAA